MERKINTTRKNSLRETKKNWCFFPDDFPLGTHYLDPKGNISVTSIDNPKKFVFRLFHHKK
jgi:hypothetical protein